MRLRAKLFAAILATMALVFLLLSLASFLNALEAQQVRTRLEGRLQAVVRQAFDAAVESGDEGAWKELVRRLEAVGAEDWAVTRAGAPVLDPERADAAAMKPVAVNGEYELLRSHEVAGLEPVRWLSTMFWALAAGTVMLLLIVYGLLLRLVLRPIEDLVAASRSLSSGGRPARVGGESRQDEMGDLIKVFNRMTNEVVISREDLKRRVEEATRDREKALQRLALEQRLSATGRLATGVAHEINNPLGGMINAARTLAGEKGLSARATEYVGLIEDGLKRIATIVERLRSFIRPHGEVARVDLVRTWRGAVSFAHHRIEKEGIALVEDCPVEAGAVAADGDAGELQQVFLNLALNALDAMGDSARKELKVSVRRTDAWAIVEVADTGVGMDAQQLANAFDLFYSTKESGTGLGLAIAHRIVTDHGGEIEIESVVGSGTTVRVKLPSPGVEA